MNPAIRHSEDYGAGKREIQTIPVDDLVDENDFVR